MRIAVNGCNGKMGTLACAAIRSHPDFQLVALQREDDLATQVRTLGLNIVVELTRADSVYRNCQAIIAGGARPVIGTSGLTEPEIAHLQQRCLQQQLGGVIAPNFSISAVLMMHFSAIAARFLTDVEIIEAHHPDKFDSPSATAIKTAAMIRRQQDKSTPSHNNTSARGNSEYGPPIHSLRLPGVVANQQVIFGSTGETLTIAHASIDRVSFMPGLLLCCEKVGALKELVYGMEHLLSLNLN